MPALLQNWSVPQAWFAHFYAVGVMSNTAVLLLYGLLCCTDGGQSDQAGAASHWAMAPP